MSSWSRSPSRTSSAPASSSPGRSANWPTPTANCATPCVYIAEQFSAARAARALYTHRNTVLNRLQRAERLLPLSLAGHGLEIGVALEIAQWLGTQPGSATHEG